MLYVEEKKHQWVWERSTVEDTDTCCASKCSTKMCLANFFIFFMNTSGCRRSMQKYILTHSRLSRRGNLSELWSIRKGPGLNFWYHSTTSRAGSGGEGVGWRDRSGEWDVWDGSLVHFLEGATLVRTAISIQLSDVPLGAKRSLVQEPRSRGTKVQSQRAASYRWRYLLKFHAALCRRWQESLAGHTHSVFTWFTTQPEQGQAAESHACPPPPPPHSQNRWTAPVIAANVARTSTVALAKTFVAANCKCALGDEYSTFAAAETVWHGSFAATKTVWHGSFAATKSIWQRR